MFKILLLCITISLADEVMKEQGVLVLNDSNFDAELLNHEFLLVEFYSPTCQPC
jgi:thioredoxin-like negative regulator of GroEL